MEILYEDNHLIAVNKTCHEIVQGDKTGDVPLSEQVKAYLKDKYNKPGAVFVGVPHRLDRPTTGVVLFTRTSKALARMNAMFSAHEGIQKTYWALVTGCPTPQEGEMTDWLVRKGNLNKSFTAQPHAKDAKEARLRYKVLKKGEHYSLVEVQLLTGRHHQIRCQFAARGWAIKGDLKYGAKRSNPDGGISLHACKLSFEHPVTKQIVEIVAENAEMSKFLAS